VELVEGESFPDLDEILDRRGVAKAAGILAELEFRRCSSTSPRRGFSFRRDGPLDMRMGTAGRTAAGDRQLLRGG
jgi:16S rRNA (cytosine1402-N4)-methyltransferase